MADKTKYYPFISKGSSLQTFKFINPSEFASAQYGEEISGSYALTSSIAIEYFDNNSDHKKLKALKNTLNNYIYLSRHYSYSSSFGDKEQQNLTLISIPSIYYGSAIDKGSVELTWYISGSLIGKIQDIKKNGELIQTTGSSGNGKVAGVVLYNEGFILLTGSWGIEPGYSEVPYGNPAWAYYNKFSVVSSSHDLNFEGINYINTITMLAHAEKGELNHSNNPTYLKFQNTVTPPVTSSSGYAESAYNKIKNTVQYPYENFEGSLEKHTYISKIGIYDENKNLIGIAKLAKPIKKTENRDFTFKLKLDI